MAGNDPAAPTGPCPVADGPEAGCGFACLHRTDRGRVFHCHEFRRTVIEFGGAHLILRPWEFRRLREHLGRIAACGFSRARLVAGERIRLRDMAGGGALILDLAGLQDLLELMAVGAARLESAGTYQIHCGSEP